MESLRDKLTGLQDLSGMTLSEIQDWVTEGANNSLGIIDDMESRLNDLLEILNGLESSKVVDFSEEIDSLEEITKSLY